MKINPKIHDALFKWLITLFTDEFFAYYFPNINIGNYRFIDKVRLNLLRPLRKDVKMAMSKKTI